MFPLFCTFDIRISQHQRFDEAWILVTLVYIVSYYRMSASMTLEDILIYTEYHISKSV